MFATSCAIASLSFPPKWNWVGICSWFSFESGMTSKIMLALGLCRSQENCHIHSELSAFKFNCNVLQVAMTHMVYAYMTVRPAHTHAPMQHAHPHGIPIFVACTLSCLFYYIYLITRVSMQYRELLHEWAWYFHKP